MSDSAMNKAKNDPSKDGKANEMANNLLPGEPDADGKFPNANKLSNEDNKASDKISNNNANNSGGQNNIVFNNQILLNKPYKSWDPDQRLQSQTNMANTLPYCYLGR